MAKFTGSFVSFVLLAASFAFATPITPLQQRQASSPAWNAIPQPNELKLQKGYIWSPFAGTRICIVDDEARQLTETAQLISSQIATITQSNPPFIVYSHENQIKKGDLVLRKTDSLSGESFMLNITDSLVISASTPSGILHGAHQVAQNLVATGNVPFGLVSAAPAVRERGLHIDMGRKQYSKEWVMQMVRNMAYVGINMFEMHFSEHEGFGIITPKFPTIASEGALTFDDIRDVIALAKQYQIQVVPSFDMPGHLEQVLSHGYEKFRLLDYFGSPVKGAVDISKPEAVEFLKSLIDEFAPLFKDSKYWNLGADEFVDFEQMWKYPSLEEAAKKKFGEAASGFDFYTDFVNDMNNYLTAKGFIVRVWNDGMFRSTQTKLSKDVEITWWTNWSPQMALLETAKEAGNRLINFNDAQLYYVLGEAAGYKYPTAEKLWENNFKPGHFPNWRDGPQNFTAPYPEKFLGSYVAIWSDHYWAQTEEEVAQGVRGPLRGMAERAWNDGTKLTIDQFNNVQGAIKNAPGVEGAMVAPGPISEDVTCIPKGKPLLLGQRRCKKPSPHSPSESAAPVPVKPTRPSKPSKPTKPKHTPKPKPKPGKKGKKVCKKFNGVKVCYWTPRG